MEVKVYTGGTFDCFHWGHVKFLKECAKFGEVWVSLNTDEFIEEFKGRRPVMSYYERYKVLQGCKYVDTVIKNYDGANSRTAILDVLPQVIAIGSDWYDKDYFSQLNIDMEFLRKWNIAIMYIPYTSGISTTDIRRRLLESGNSN